MVMYNPTKAENEIIVVEAKVKDAIAELRKAE